MVSNVVIVIERYEGIFSQPGIGEYGKIDKIADRIEVEILGLYSTVTGTNRAARTGRQFSLPVKFWKSNVFSYPPDVFCAVGGLAEEVPADETGLLFHVRIAKGYA
jgi:hypothetical protein